MEEIIKKIHEDYIELDESWKKKKINFYRNEIRSYLPNYADEDLMKVQWEPLIIEKDEWEILEKGVKQRFLAINRYVKDFYLNKNIIIPNEIMFESKFYNTLEN